MSREERFHTKRLDNPRYPYLAKASIDTIKFHHSLKEYKSVLDVGSSCGVLLKEMEKIKSFDNLVGTDYGEYPEKHWCNSGEYINNNLNEETVIDSKFDLITCLEVAEHLQTEKFCFKMINECSHENSILIFSGAYPGQRGRGHINCHWHGYWQNELEKDGWLYNHQMTSYFLYYIGKANHKKVKVPTCYLNTMVFQKKKDVNSEDGMAHKI